MKRLGLQVKYIAFSTGKDFLRKDINKQQNSCVLKLKSQMSENTVVFESWKGECKKKVIYNQERFTFNQIVKIWTNKKIPTQNQIVQF